MREYRPASAVTTNNWISGEPQENNTAADGVAHAGKGLDVDRRVSGQHSDVGVHAGSDSSAALRFAETLSRGSRERSEDLAPIQPGTSHQCVFPGWVVIGQVADVGAKERICPPPRT